MTPTAAIQVRDELIKNLELLNFILTTPLGVKHPNYEELKKRYSELKQKLEVLKSDSTEGE